MQLLWFYNILRPLRGAQVHDSSQTSTRGEEASHREADWRESRPSRGLTRSELVNFGKQDWGHGAFLGGTALGKQMRGFGPYLGRTDWLGGPDLAAGLAWPERPGLGKQTGLTWASWQILGELMGRIEI